MTDIKMTDQIAGHENAGHEIARHDKYLFIVRPLPVILAVLWKILCNTYVILFISSSIVDKN